MRYMEVRRNNGIYEIDYELKIRQFRIIDENDNIANKGPRTKAYHRTFLADFCFWPTFLRGTMPDLTYTPAKSWTQYKMSQNKFTIFIYVITIPTANHLK